MSYEWYTDPAGNRHFQRTFPKKGKKAAEKPAVVVAEPVVEAPVEVAAEPVVVEPVAEGPKKVVTGKRAPAKKKSDG